MTVLMYDLRLKNIPAEVWMGILVLACTILLFTSGVKNVLPASGSVEKKVILIAKEKDINLAIAKKLKVCLEKAGFEVVMTREADESVKGPEQGNKKSTDMRNRCAKIRETKPAMAVSIHQNSYTEEYVSGPQVFYYTTSAEGKEIAGCIQNVMNKELQIERPREIKANDTYYILKRSEAPAVIVECGFLSNEREAALLITDTYQQKAAESICDGIQKYFAAKM